MLTDKIFMRVAIDKAWEYQLLTYPNPAVGALTILDGKILAVEAHTKAGTSHAEVLALIGAYEEISNRKVGFNRFDADLAHRMSAYLCQTVPLLTVRYTVTLRGNVLTIGKRPQSWCLF